MTMVILLFPDGNRQAVILDGIPAQGDSVRLRDGRVLNVIHRLWMDSSNGDDPSVLISVRLPGE